MILSRTPLRISFCGGGSDIKNYYRQHGGAVISVAINQYIYLSLHPYFYGNKYFLKYSKSEIVDDVNHIKHRIIKQIFKDYNVDGIDFNSSADIPSGTGLGSSSAFTVGLINLCNAYTNRYANKEAMAAQACEIEIEKLGEPIGKQDQYCSAIGGLNYIKFNKDDSVEVEKLIIDPHRRKYLENNLLLFYTGIVRSASQVLRKQLKRMKGAESNIITMHKIVKLVSDLKNEIQNGNIDALGQILHENWMYKQKLTPQTSNEKIDHYYKLAIQNGAEGGKLLGAGGGGFLLLYVKENNHEKIRKALSGLKEVSFTFDNVGTNIIYYD